jgi:hypothetical protein
MNLNKDWFLSRLLKKNFFHIVDLNYEINDIFNLNTLIENNSIYSLSIKKIDKSFPTINFSKVNFDFDFVGLLTTYQLDLLPDNELFQSSKNVRFASPNDIKELKRIAYNNFEDDKFHNDSSIPKSLSDEYFSTWIENSCNGLTDIVLVYEENNYIVGFLTANFPKKDKDYCQIVLNAIDKIYTKQGKYKELLSHAIKLFIEKGYRKVQIGTYEKSLGVHITLNKYNFKAIYYSYIYHLHS